VQNLPQKEAGRRLAQEEAANEGVTEANAKLEQILLRFQASTQQKSKEGEGFFMRDAQAAIAAVVEEYATKPVASITSTSANGVELDGRAGDGEPLRVGEQVIIKRLGKLPATVVEIPQAENDYLTVQAGTMKMRVKLHEIVSRVARPEKEGARKPTVQKAKVSCVLQPPGPPHPDLVALRT
jgi:dsDNA-specific endonuclease/ATPase MutS2